MREMNLMWRSTELGVTQRIRQKLERQRAKCGRRGEKVFHDSTGLAMQLVHRQ